MRPKSDAQEFLDMLAAKAVRRLKVICWGVAIFSFLTLGFYAVLVHMLEAPGTLGGYLLLGSAFSGALAYFWGQYLLMSIHVERGTFGRNRSEVRVLLAMIAVWQKENGFGDIIEADKKRYQEQLKEAIRIRNEAELAGKTLSEDGPF